MDQEAGTGRRVDERLARLLGPGPRHADDPEQTADVTDAEPADDWLADTRSSVLPVLPVPPAAAGGRGGMLRRIWEQRFGGWSFGSSQLAVIAVIVLLGLGLAGWSVLRARPVALASGASSDGTTATGAAPRSTAGPSGAGTVGPSAGGPTAVPAQASAASPTTSSESMIQVHVLGAVRHPGVVRLAAGSRVQDALDRAGGTKKSAHLGDLNLAQPLADGQQIFIARHGGRSEVREPATVPAGPSGSGPPGAPAAPGSSATGESTAAPGQVVNLNTATTDELDQLPGIGPVTAQKIIDWRTQHGRFNAVEELQEVDGIGPKTYADLASMVTV